MRVTIRKLEPSEYGLMQKMARKKWDQAHGRWEYYDLFDLDYIELMMKSGEKDDHAMMGAFIENELVGTAGILAFHAVVRGTPMKLAYGSWLTSDFARINALTKTEKDRMFHWEKRRNGIYVTTYSDKSLGSLIVSAAFEYCRDHAIQGLIAYFEKESHSYRIVRENSEKSRHVRAFRPLKETYSYVKIVNMDRLLGRSDISFALKLGARLIRLSRIPASGKIFPENVIPYSDVHLKDCVMLLNGYRDTADVARVWAERELTEQLSPGQMSATHVFVKKGAVKGLINYVVMNSVGDQGRFPYAMLDHLHFSHLSFEEKKYFIAHVLEQIRRKGITGAIFRHMNYFDESIFKAMTFRKNRRKLSQMVILFDDFPDMAQVKGTYLSFL